MVRRYWVVAAISATVLAVFGQVWNFGFVSYDDPDYVTQNLHVLNGISYRGIVWAFTSSHSSNWHPLTWISHMLDCQFFGLNPGPHHLTNLLLHLVNTLLLFGILKKMTDAFWRSALVALLFAVHPLHVQSVAWIAERKDVLSTLFWMAAIWTYVGYVKQRSIRQYLLSLLAFTCGLLSKPMVVTLPFVLLLLDFWPLQRFDVIRSAKNGKVKRSSKAERIDRRPVARQLLIEKLPFFLLAAAGSAVTYLSQKGWGAVVSTAEVPIGARIGNALLSYLRYIGKMFWPADLSVFYPINVDLDPWLIAGAGIVLIGITILVVRSTRERPYMALGWFWYLGVLVPVIGFVQVGAQSMADRYAYIPLIGLFIMVAWSLPELTKANSAKLRTVISGIAVLLISMSICSWRQVRCWKDSVSLFEHALRVDENNYMAHGSLGFALADSGRVDEAIPHYEKALRINPNYATGHVNLGLALAGKGETREAIANYREAVRLKPSAVEALNNLAWILATNPDPVLRDAGEAIPLAEKADRLSENENPTVLDTLAAAYAEGGRFEEAIKSTQKAEDLALSLNQQDLAKTLQQRMTLYRAGRPYHENLIPVFK
jgi:protein O-mannosyl-transferase